MILLYTAWLSDKNIYPYAHCFYDNSTDAKTLQLINPTLELEANKAGSFSFTVPPDHFFYGKFTPFSSIITVVRDGDVLWEGRVINEQKDFLNQAKYSCEGCLAYLNDSVQPYNKYINPATPWEILIKILNVHNSYFSNTDEEFKIILPGQNRRNFSDIIMPEVFNTNYESTMEILSKLQEEYEGYMYITWDAEGKKYLNWTDDENLKNCEQAIEFGSNLLDYTRDWDITDLCTVVVPLGVQIGTEEEGNEEERLTIKDVNDGSIFVTATSDILNKYGYVVKTLEFDDIEDPEILKHLGELYLTKGQFEKMTIEISAFDLAMLNKKKEWEPPSSNHNN